MTTNLRRVTFAHLLGKQVDIATHLCTLAPKALMIFYKFARIWSMTFVPFGPMLKGELLGKPVCLTNAPR